MKEETTYRHDFLEWHVLKQVLQKLFLKKAFLTYEMAAPCVLFPLKTNPLMRQDVEVEDSNIDLGFV